MLTRIRLRRRWVVAGAVGVLIVGSGGWALAAQRQAREATREATTAEAAAIAGPGRAVRGSWHPSDLGLARDMVDGWADQGSVTPRSTAAIITDSTPETHIDSVYRAPDGQLRFYVIGAKDRKDHNCGADYRAAALETDSAAAVLVIQDRGTWPDGGVACASVGQIRVATVQLGHPLGDRPVLDVAVGRVVRRLPAPVRIGTG